MPFIDQGLGPKLERDGLISGAVLVVLLLPIIVYALVRRRRARAGPPARGEREPAARSVHAPASEAASRTRCSSTSPRPAQPPGARGARAWPAPGSAHARRPAGAVPSAASAIPPGPVTTRSAGALAARPHGCR